MKMMYLPLLFLCDDLVLYVRKKYHISSPNYSLYNLLTHQKGGGKDFTLLKLDLKAYVERVDENF